MATKYKRGQFLHLLRNAKGGELTEAQTAQAAKFEAEGVEARHAAYDLFCRRNGTGELIVSDAYWRIEKLFAAQHQRAESYWCVFLDGVAVYHRGGVTRDEAIKMARDIYDGFTSEGAEIDRQSFYAIHEEFCTTEEFYNCKLAAEHIETLTSLSAQAEADGEA